jgi:hypothetical protein
MYHQLKMFSDQNESVYVPMCVENDEPTTASRQARAAAREDKNKKG